MPYSSVPLLTALPPFSLRGWRLELGNDYLLLTEGDGLEDVIDRAREGEGERGVTGAAAVGLDVSRVEAVVARAEQIGQDEDAVEQPRREEGVAQRAELRRHQCEMAVRQRWRAAGAR